MREYVVRFFYITVSLVMIILAYTFSEEFLGEPAKPLDYFSYVGTVATLIGLLVAVCEVVHSVHISKSIKDEALVVLNRVKLVENASTISDCLSAIDDVSANISTNDYKLALKSYQYFRKLCTKAIPDFNLTEDAQLGGLGQLELSIISATHSTEEAPLNKVQKNRIHKDLLIVKRTVEECSPVRGGKDVTG